MAPASARPGLRRHTALTALPFIALSSGEPAGIGPDICVELAAEELPCRLAVLGDPAVLAERAAQLAVPVAVETLTDPESAGAHEAGTMQVVAVAAHRRVVPGRLDAANADYVLELLRAGAGLCARGASDALVTAPLQKSIIVAAGHAFSGHTEFLAELTGAEQPVMLLAGRRLRVALATTHVPLAAVPDRLSTESLERVGRVLDADLRRLFGLAAPRILVLGLNPHAGEGGTLGSEEQTVIAPAVEALRARGIDAQGPVAGDTAFTPDALARCDVVLAMYHDQGLAPIKALEFGDTVNVTLGLPIIRTSVDHGTALALAGTGRARHASLREAVRVAIELAARARAAA